MSRAKPSARPSAPPSERPTAPVGPSSGRITLRDVARALGVSVATVSNAYNRPDQLSPPLRARILETAARLGYAGPDPLARSLRRRQTGVIGVVYDAPLDYAFADPAAALFLGSVAHAIQERGLNLLLLACPQGSGPVRTASVDGLIVYCAPRASALLAAVIGRRLPTVLMDHDPHPQAVQVGIADAAGAEDAARHLAALGHRELGVISLPLGQEEGVGPVSPAQEAAARYRTSAERLAGYRAGAPGATLYPFSTSGNTLQQGEAAALALLRAHPQVTALLCMSDVLAQGARRAARTLGRRVPQDLSLVGYDDLPGSAALDLTTVWQPTADKGRHVAGALLALLAGERPPDVTLPTRLVVRGSTALPASR